MSSLFSCCGVEKKAKLVLTALKVTTLEFSWTKGTSGEAELIILEGLIILEECSETKCPEKKRSEVVSPEKEIMETSGPRNAGSSVPKTNRTCSSGKCSRDWDQNLLKINLHFLGVNHSIPHFHGSVQLWVKSSGGLPGFFRDLLSDTEKCLLSPARTLVY